MNHCVPDFEIEDDYSIPTPSSAHNGRKSTALDDEIMELSWKNGQVVMQRTTGQKKSESNRTPQQPDNQNQNQQHLFMQEDEMASWLQYPLGDDDTFCADLLYASADSNATAAASHPPPLPRPPIHQQQLPNFLHFSSRSSNNQPPPPPRLASAPSVSKSVVRESTAVDSSDTPLLAPTTSSSRPNNINTNDAAETSGGGGRGLGLGLARATSIGTSSGIDVKTCDMSSPGGSSASGSASGEQISSQKQPPAATEDRKRKGRETDDAECQSEDVEFESASAKKQNRGSSSTKRSRAAEVHNLSERRRRDRINEKMRALQELIPRCNKSDKASMLDEAIEYLKSLQLQVQMMSMGCGMVPMMFPGVQPYMGMGMGMGMGMARPVMPFANVLAGSPMPTTATAAMGPRFPMPAFQMQTMLPNDPSRVQPTNPPEQMLNSLGTQNPSQPQMPNFADPYQQYFTSQQMQLPLQQNQAMGQPGNSKANSSRGPEDHESHQ